MAKKDTPPAVIAGTPAVIAGTPAVIAGTDPQSMPPAPTPENTPVPGGGRYRWSDTAPHWTEIDEDGNPVAVIAGHDPQSMPPITPKE